MARNSTHFAFALAGHDNAFCAPFRQQAAHLPRGMKMSTVSAPPPQPTAAIPTLGSTGVKFNSSRWTNVGEEMGISVFDTKGAMDCIQNGPDECAKKRVHPAALAHANRVARAQQVGFALYGYKVFPDLTPGRAFMWGSIFAAWAVGSAALVSARALDIHTVDDVKVKLQTAFAPLKESLHRKAGEARTSIELKEQPASFQHLQSFGENLRRALS